MACSLIAGAPLEAPFAELLKVVMTVFKKTAKFESPLERLKSTLNSIHPIILEVAELDKILDHHTNDETSSFLDLLESGKTLILKCGSIQCWHIRQKYRHSNKLRKLDAVIFNYFLVRFQVQSHAQLSSICRQTLIGLQHLTFQNERILSAVTTRFGVSGSCSVPDLPDLPIGLDLQVEELKGVLLKDDSSVVVLSAPGGCGKTTLAKMLCHDDEIRGKKLCCHFTLSEIESATQNFDEELVIGQGGFGKVYRGTFDDGSTAAIKRLDSGSKQGASEFRAEIETLSRLRHCHLVSLTGYCDDENEMILVYELMAHGSLADHLHKLRTRLSWLQRLRICIGAARGLDYLHSGTGTHHGVIHRDIKSSNILLDDNWEAKISDFGLSKIGPTNQPSTSVSTAIKGTTGYLDPEYSLTGRLTRKSDVYSFGVVLLEVLCGRRAVDRSRDEEQWGLVGWAKDSIKEGNLLEIIDSTLSGQILLNCSSKFSQIALRCVHNRPKERPTMAEVVVDLESALALQESLDYSEPDYAEPDYVSTPAKKISYIRKIQKFFFPSMPTYSGKTLQSVDHVVAGQKSNETHVSPPRLPSILEGPSSLIAGSDEDGNGYKLLPAIEGLQIIGEAFPGRELQASGYSINGTTSCMFQWVRHMEDGSVNYIDQAKQPIYVVTSDDVDTYLAVEVQPWDDKQRKGELIKCFANSNRKISCDPEMSRHIERTLIAGQASYKLHLWTGSQDTREPATLEIETEGFRIRNSRTNGVVATEKFSPATVVDIQYESPSEFSITGFGGIIRLLKTESTTTDVSCSRDTMALTLRLFIKRAVEEKKGKKKRVLFFLNQIRTFTLITP